MIIKFKISIPLKEKMFNWRCNLHFHCDLKKLKRHKNKQRNTKSDKEDKMKKIEVIEDNLHSVNY